MTKSKGTGRGGARPGAGRRPRAANVDWNAVARAYYTGTESLDMLLEKFGLEYGDLLAYGASNHWLQRRPVKQHPDDLGGLASALAMEIFFTPVDDRPRRFVTAMAALCARPENIADPLNISVDDLKSDFKKELAGALLKGG